MELKEFAKKLSGREYAHPQFTKEVLKQGKENADENTTDFV